MKIAVIYQGIFPPVKGASGADRRVRDITRGISKAGNAVYLFVPIWHDRGIINQDILDFKIEYLGKKFLSRLIVLNRITFWYKIKKRAIALKLDAVLFYNPTIDAIYTMKWLRKNGIIVAAEFCDLISSNKSSSFFMNPKNFLWKMGEDKTPAATDINYVISDFLEEKVKQNASITPVIKIPILVDPDLFKMDFKKRKTFRERSNIADDEIIIAYVGGIWYNEGVDFLIHSFKKLLEEKVNVRFIIAGKLGSSEMHVDAKKMTEDLDISGKVILTGWIGTDEVISLFSAADILIVPQIKSNFCVAGLPTKLAEYAAMGKAIVATKVGDVPVYFKHLENALLCDPSNAEDLAAKIRVLVEDENLRRRLGENAKETALKTFDYRVNGKKISQSLKVE